MSLSEPQYDALVPADMAERAEQVGVKKACLNAPSTFVLATLAGAFIAFGAVFSTTVLAGAQPVVPYGVARLLGGLVFSLGLILVLVGGAELFTGNNLIIIAWASGRVSTRQLLRNWGIVYVGNFVGAVAVALVVYISGQFGFGQGAVGAAALAAADSKAGLGFVQALMLGVLGNVLVCLAVWLTFSARTTTDRVAAIVAPITAFVAAGFEHSVANMYFIPIGLFIKAGAPPAFWAEIGRSAADFAQLKWANFLVGNLLPVTLGNMLGGLFVGITYWFVYLRPRRLSRPAPALQPGLDRPELAVAAAGDTPR